MDSTFTPKPMLGRSTTLPGGQRVRLRLARARNEASVRDLVARTGGAHSELDIARLVRFDPRERMVICALLDTTDMAVGVGAIRMDSDRPELLIADEQVGEALAQLLETSLHELQRARAA
jgi:hypothetical protein